MKCVCSIGCCFNTVEPLENLICEYDIRGSGANEFCESKCEYRNKFCLKYIQLLDQLMSALPIVSDICIIKQM